LYVFQRTMVVVTVEVTEVVLGKLSSVLSQYVVSFNYVEEFDFVEHWHHLSIDVDQPTDQHSAAYQCTLSVCGRWKPCHITSRCVIQKRLVSVTW